MGMTADVRIVSYTGQRGKTSWGGEQARAPWLGPLDLRRPWDSLPRR